LFAAPEVVRSTLRYFYYADFERSVNIIVSSPVPRAKQPKWHESSPLQSFRENDSTSRQWLRASKNGYNTDGIARQVGVLTQQMGRYRRRIVGGGASTSSGGMQWKGEYNGGSYKAQNVVTFTPNGASAGNYVALKDVPSGTAPDTGFPYWQAFSVPSPGVWS